MEYFVQQLINGITLGTIYGLIAIGYTMVYGIIGMINFAHGDIFMVGAFLSLIAFLGAGRARASPRCRWRWPDRCCSSPWPSTALYGWTVERVAYRPLRGSFRLAPLISAIGMSIMLQNFVQVARARAVKPLPPLIPGGYHADSTATASPCGCPGCRSSSSSTTLVLMAGFTWLVTRTPLGRAMRACEQDLKMAACSASTPTAPSRSPSSSARRWPPSPG